MTGLMADRVLREPCEHGRYEAHSYDHDVSTIAKPCPGGREVLRWYRANRIVTYGMALWGRIGIVVGFCVGWLLVGWLLYG